MALIVQRLTGLQLRLQLVLLCLQRVGQLQARLLGRLAQCLLLLLERRRLVLLVLLADLQQTEETTVSETRQSHWV